MKLYDECLEGVKTLTEEYGFVKLGCGDSDWKDAGQNQLIFQADTAYELGGGNLPAISSIALTDKSEYVPEDEILLYGKDLQQINSNTPFARIALIRVNEDAMGDGNKLYQTVRKIEYTRYHLNPEGYMMRISAFTHRESARVSKQALKKGLSFADVGSLFIKEYHKQPQVEAVKLIFVTDESFPYEKLSEIMQKSEDITKALDHIMKNIKMDCDACSLKAVCEEVEELCNSEKE